MVLKLVDEGFSGVILTPEGDSHFSIGYLLGELKMGRLKIAPHQRAFVWTKEKVNAWAKTLINGVKPNASQSLGVMVTYQLSDTGEYFLNDGFQRLTATELFISNAKQYGLTPEQATRITHSFKVFVQHRHYDDHVQAMYWFQVLQLGTPLSAYEFSAGYLRYTPDGTNWIPTLEGVHEFMAKAIRENSHPPTGGFGNSVLTIKHIWQRHNYSLLYSFLAHFQPLKPRWANVGTKTLKLESAQSEQMIEQVLAAYLSLHTYREVAPLVRDFEKFIEAQIRTIEASWRTIKGQEARKPSATLLRFILEVAVWSFNNNYPAAIFEQFVTVLFSYSDGSSTLVLFQTNENGKYEKVVLAMNRIDVIRRVARLIDFEPYKKLQG